MATVLVNLAGLLLMGAIVWWFWLSESGGAGDQHEHH